MSAVHQTPKVTALEAVTRKGADNVIARQPDMHITEDNQVDAKAAANKPFQLISKRYRVLTFGTITAVLAATSAAAPFGVTATTGAFVISLMGAGMFGGIEIEQRSHQYKNTIIEKYADKLQPWFKQSGVSLDSRRRNQVVRMILNIEPAVGTFMDIKTSQQYTLQQNPEKGTWYFSKTGTIAANRNHITPLTNQHPTLTTQHETITRRVSTLADLILTRKEERLLKKAIQQTNDILETVTQLENLNDDSYHAEASKALQNVNDSLETIILSQRRMLKEQLQHMRME